MNTLNLFVTLLAVCISQVASLECYTCSAVSLMPNAEKCIDEDKLDSNFLRTCPPEQTQCSVVRVQREVTGMLVTSLTRNCSDPGALNMCNETTNACIFTCTANRCNSLSVFPFEKNASTSESTTTTTTTTPSPAPVTTKQPKSPEEPKSTPEPTAAPEPTTQPEAVTGVVESTTSAASNVHLVQIAVHLLACSSLTLLLL